MKRIGIIIIFYFLCNSIIYGQNFENIHLDNDKNKMVDHFAFYDETTREVINTFNIEENNPFKYLYPYASNIPGGSTTHFDLKDTNYNTLGSLQPNLEGYSYGDANSIITRAILVKKVPVPKYYNNPNFTIVCYNLHIYSGDTVSGFISYLYILDKNGEIHAKFENRNHPFKQYAVTNDGKYFVYSYGGVNDESLRMLFGINYNIMNLDNGKVILTKELPKHESIRGIKNYDNCISIRRPIYRAYEDVFIDFDKGILYSKTYIRSERDVLTDITTTGYKFMDRFESYEEYFQKEYIDLE